MIRDTLRQQLSLDREKLASGLELNKQKEKIADEVAELTEDYLTISNKLQDIQSLLKIIQVFTSKFRDSRIRELEERMEAILSLAFPSENFGVKITKDVLRNKDVSSLLIGPKNTPVDCWSTPTTINGGLVNQLITAAAVAEICKMRQVDYIFLDEMFCSGDPVAVSDISPFFDSIIQSDIQLLIIEHKPSLYEDLNRREFRFGKDRIHSQELHLLSVEDK